MHATTGRWKLGLLLALMTALFWGVLPLALKVTLRGMDAYTLTWYRFLVAAIALGAYLAWRQRLPAAASLRGAGWKLYAAALVGLVANYVLYLLSLELTSPTIAQVLIQLAPVFLLLGGLVVFREPFSRLQWAGFAVLLAGLGLFFRDRITEVIHVDTPLGLGVALMIGAAVVWTAYALAQKQLLTRLASGQILFLVYVGAVPLLLPFAHPSRLLALDRLELAALAFCCANTVIAYGCFAEALEHWEVSRVSAVLALGPMFTMLAMVAAAALWPGLLPPEGLKLAHLLGACLVIAGSMTCALGSRTGRD